MNLKTIQTILEKEQLVGSIFPAGEDSPIDRLLIFLSVDSKKRERLLEITMTDPLAPPEHLLPQAQSLPCRIQFRLQFPFLVQNNGLNQIASMFLFLNHLAEFPGFELDELNGKIFFRYVWLTQSNSLEPHLITTIISAILININLFSDSIESLIDGKTSFNDFLSQIVHLNEEMKK